MVLTLKGDLLVRHKLYIVLPSKRWSDGRGSVLSNTAKQCQDTARFSLTRCEGESGLLIGTRGFGSDGRQCCRGSAGSAGQSGDGSAGQCARAARGSAQNKSGAMQPPTPPPPCAERFASPTQTITAVLDSRRRGSPRCRRSRRAE